MDVPPGEYSELFDADVDTAWLSGGYVVRPLDSAARVDDAEIGESEEPGVPAEVSKLPEEPTLENCEPVPVMLLPTGDAAMDSEEAEPGEPDLSVEMLPGRVVLSREDALGTGPDPGAEVLQEAVEAIPDTTELDSRPDAVLLVYSLPPEGRTLDMPTEGTPGLLLEYSKTELETLGIGTTVGAVAAVLNETELISIDGEAVVIQDDWARLVAKDELGPDSTGVAAPEGDIVLLRERLILCEELNPTGGDCVQLSLEELQLGLGELDAGIDNAVGLPLLTSPAEEALSLLNGELMPSEVDELDMSEDG